MAANKKSFIVYTSWKVWLDGLTQEQKGKWLDWMMAYCNDLNPDYPQDQAVKVCCMMAQDTLKRDLKKYELKVESVQKARQQRKEKNANTEINLKSNRNQSEISSVNVNVNVNDNVLDKSNTNNKDTNVSYIVLSENEKTVLKDDLNKKIFDYWNSKKIVVHKKFTEEIDKALTKALSYYSKEEIGHAIEHYATVYNDKNYFFSYKWTLIEFLSRKNGLPEFLEEGSKWLNYKNRNNPNFKNQTYNSYDDLPEEARAWMEGGSQQ